MDTRFLMLSDTHGEALLLSREPVDVAIHFGDLTEESKTDEIRASIRLLKQISAPLKLVIAGNHDFTLDVPVFKKKLAAIKPPLSIDSVKREYGGFGEARALIEDARDAGVVSRDEGTHSFTLANGAALTVYASSYTPSLNDWDFQYNPQAEHDWSIGAVDVVITHGPPRGVLDYTDSKQRAGSSSLFAAVAHAQPRMHCFCHIHEGWGAKNVAWRSEGSETPSHFTAMEHESSTLIESLSTIHARKSDGPDDVAQKEAKSKDFTHVRYCMASPSVQQSGQSQTLFANAAIEGTEGHPRQLPWMVNVKLPRASFAVSPSSIEKKRKRPSEHGP